MKNLTFLDFETTGLINKGEDMPLVIQAAMKEINGDKITITNEYFGNNNERLNVAVRTETGILEKDIKDREPFKQSKLLAKILDKQNSTIFIAHNGIDFDFKIIEHLGFKPKYYIDTLKIIQYLITDKKELDLLEGRFKLGYIRFYLQDKNLLDKSYTDKPLNFHSADYDVETLEQIFNGMVKLYGLKNPGKTENDIYLDFYNISKAPMLLTFVNFGKNIGMKYSELDEGYLKWCFNNLKGERGIDFDHTIEHYYKIKNPALFGIKTEQKKITKSFNKKELNKTPILDIEKAPIPKIMK